MKAAVAAFWSAPVVLLVIVVVITAVAVYDLSRPRSVVIRFTDGPTVLTTAVVPLR